MSKKLADLDVQVDGDVVLRFTKSEKFLAGETEAIDLGGKNRIMLSVFRVFKWLGWMSLIGILGLSFYVWMWDGSPLTGSVTARVVGIEKKSQGGNVSFEYDVDGQAYVKTQYANSLRRDWREGPKTGAVIYLQMFPSQAKLKTTIERMDWSMLVLGPILPLGFLIGGIMGQRSAQRMSQIEDNATHLLQGVVNNRFPIKGMIVVQYKTNSPIDGTEIFGSVEVGKLESVAARLQVGTPVVVVYANDKSHSLL